MPRIACCTILTLAFCPGVGQCQEPLSGPALEAALLGEDPEQLARQARDSGDAERGAIAFFGPYMQCAQCHEPESEARRLGPDLARWKETPQDADLVEAILRPSKKIAKGFESVVVVTNEGKSVVGLVVEETPQTLTLRDPAQEGRALTLQKDRIDERAENKLSLMPQGLARQLVGRQQLLDLLKYLMEIAAGGPARAEELRPPPGAIFSRPLPEYEARIDHAGMLRELDGESFARGRAIYERLCVNCHGTHERPGSLPNSLRFASGQFKNGFDPYRMYQTLTRGFGRMVPQAWMVPRQKYDVIHYIRQAYLKRHNPSQYAAVGQDYLASLPEGETRGPAPSKFEPWVTMDYGPALAHTYELSGSSLQRPNLAYKGIALRLDPGPGGVSRGRQFVIFDHDTLRMAGAYRGEGFIDYAGIMFDGRHGAHPHTVGSLEWENPVGPGWAHPSDGSFDDPRLRGRDGRPYGPLPREWARFRGTYRHGQRTVLSYTVGGTEILESPELVSSPDPPPIFGRNFEIGPRDTSLVLQVARLPNAKLETMDETRARSGFAAMFGDTKASSNLLAAGVSPSLPGAAFSADSDGNLRLKIPKGAESLRFMLWLTRVFSRDEAIAAVESIPPAEPSDLRSLIRGGPSQWPEKLTTKVMTDAEDGPFATDVLTHPRDNPWFCRMRFTGLDFFPDGRRMAVCSWDGIVWLVEGIGQEPSGGEKLVELTWRRIASGLFQPLGLKIIDGKVYVGCRDQIAVLHDLNGDGETDFYECFNNDHQVTEHFHEFAMGLQTDAAGNLYYAKSARHALPAIVPHHGTLLRVSPDGSRTDILATGFRAANGVCVNGDGTFFVTDQEGHWTPKNRINLVREGGFYGNIFGYTDVTDTSDDAMQPPLCWITNDFDRSPAELLRVPKHAWGPLAGALLNLSYGYGKIYVVPDERIGDLAQGGMCELPIRQFPTGVMRGRFHPDDGHLYLCGMFAWGGNQQQEGGLYRVRYTGAPVHVPLSMNVRPDGLSISFSGRLDPDSAADVSNYSLRTWSLKRTAKYGSKHFDEKTFRVTAACLSEDGKTLELTIPNIAPTHCMSIRYRLQSSSGAAIRGEIHNTIHRVLGK